MKAVRFVLVLGTVTWFLPQIGWGQNTRVDKKLELNYARRAARSLSLLAANGGGSMLRRDIELLASPPLREWVGLNKAALVGANPNPFPPPTRWGLATTNGSSLYLHILAWPKSGKLAIPRLHNSVMSVQFTDDDAELNLSPNVNNWEITLPERQKRNGFIPLVHVQLDRPLRIGQDSPPVVVAQDNGVIRLHARDAVTHGQMLRFEPQPPKNTVGYWVQENDWVEWAFEPQEKTPYNVVLRYGCGEGEGGSEIEVKVGVTPFPFVVEATGGFQTWREVTIGTLEELSGKTPVSVKPLKKAKNAIMDLQEIRLEPR